MFGWCKYLFGLYLLVCVYQIGVLLWPPSCTDNLYSCIQPAFDSDTNFTLSFHSTLTKAGGKDINSLPEPFFTTNASSLSKIGLTQKLNVSVPSSTRLNGTQWVHVVIQNEDPVSESESPSPNPWYFIISAKLTQYRVTPVANRSMLLKLSNQSEPAEDDLYFADAYASRKAITNWRKRLAIRIVDFTGSFRNTEIPMELGRLRMLADGKYLPIATFDDFGMLRHDWGPMSRNLSKETAELELDIIPTNLGLYRFIKQMEVALNQMQAFGVEESDMEELKELFSRHRFWHIVLQYSFMFLHMFFSYLAFKNEVGFFAQTKNTKGLSTRSVISKFVMQFIIFLYLCDYETISKIVLWMHGISVAIEAWKITRVLKARFSFRGVTLEAKDEDEEETDKYDALCFKWVGSILFPILIAYAVYQLINSPQKSWWSWLVQNLAYSVYLCGFIMMVPQLYINYKLKSVAHLPWKAMMYKTFNTFIDDVFAFMVDMPWSHRVATFRDDILFFVFLYQRWIYRTDFTRVNEFGIQYEKTEEELEAEKAEKAKLDAEKESSGKTSDETSEVDDKDKERLDSSKETTGGEDEWEVVNHLPPSEQRMEGKDVEERAQEDGLRARQTVSTEAD